MTPSMIVESSEMLFEISVTDLLGMRNGLSDRFAEQNISKDMVSKKETRFVVNMVQRVTKKSGRKMKLGTNQPVSIAVERPAIIETRGKRNGFSITGCPFCSPEKTRD
jgi:hypothetical protein